MRTLIIVSVLAMTSCLTPGQTGAIGQAACTLVGDLTDSGTAESMCATASELAQIAALVLSAHTDASAKTAGKCTEVPQHPEACATSSEMSSAIRTVKAAR